MRRIWRTILFSDESRFTLKFSDGRLRVWRLPGERYSDGSVLEAVVKWCGEEFISGERQIWLFYGKMN